MRIVQAYSKGEESTRGIAREHDMSRDLLRFRLEERRGGQSTEEGDRRGRTREYEVEDAPRSGRGVT